MSNSKLKALGYSQSEIILIGRLLAAANQSMWILRGIQRNSMEGKRLVAHARRHAEQMRMAWDYGCAC